jgi:hypothetical protein
MPGRERTQPNGREQAIRHLVHDGFPSSFVEHLVIERDRENLVRTARIVVAAIFLEPDILMLITGGENETL